MYSEHLALWLLLVAAQAHTPHALPPPPPADARHALIRALREPELVAALSQRLPRAAHLPAPQTRLASSR